MHRNATAVYMDFCHILMYRHRQMFVVNLFCEEFGTSAQCMGAVQCMLNVCSRHRRLRLRPCRRLDRVAYNSKDYHAVKLNRGSTSQNGGPLTHQIIPATKYSAIDLHDNEVHLGHYSKCRCITYPNP
jgi:hypothetical protein